MGFPPQQSKALEVFRNCPECDCFVVRHEFPEKCPNCGHPYERTEHDIRKEEWNRRLEQSQREEVPSCAP